MGEMRADRVNWLEHLHGCPECQRRYLCDRGLELVEAMRASMTSDESLDLERIGLVQTD